MGQQARSVMIQRAPAQINVSCTDLKSRKINFVNSNPVAMWLIDEMLMIRNMQKKCKFYVINCLPQMDEVCQDMTD